MEITTHIVLHTKCIEKTNKLILYFFNNYRYTEPTHTRNKYTLCHKETIALNDEKSRVNRTKIRFFYK